VTLQAPTTANLPPTHPPTVPTQARGTPLLRNCCPPPRLERIVRSGAQDEFFVLASDGLYDVLDDQAVIDSVPPGPARPLPDSLFKPILLSILSLAKTIIFFAQVSRSLLRSRNDCGLAATALAELAIARGSLDNVSALVVRRAPPAPFPCAPPGPGQRT
jgi:serine/threonine protein phosphatase PrpC